MVSKSSTSLMTDLLEVDKEKILLSVKSMRKNRLVEIVFNKKRVINKTNPGAITDRLRSIF